MEKIYTAESLSGNEKLTGTLEYYGGLVPFIKSGTRSTAVKADTLKEVKNDGNGMQSQENDGLIRFAPKESF